MQCSTMTCLGSQSPLWTSTPCSHRYVPLISSQCLCFQGAAEPSFQKIDQHSLSSNESSCYLQPINQLVSVVQSAKHSSTPVQQVCSCVTNEVDRNKLNTPVKCLCGTQQNIYHSFSGVDASVKLGNVLPNYAAQHAMPRSRGEASCIDKSSGSVQNCQKVLFAPNEIPVKDCSSMFKSQVKENSQPSCQYMSHFSSLCNCPAKHTRSVLPYCSCVYRVNSLCEKSSVKEETAASDSISSYDLLPKYGRVFNCETDVGCNEGVNVLKWQHQHMQQLQIQKSEIFGKKLAPAEISSLPKIQNKDQLDSRNSVLDKDRGPEDTSHHSQSSNGSYTLSEGNEALIKRIEELERELECERMKVELYQSLYKQSKDELECLQARCFSKTDKLVTSDVDWESYCVENGTESYFSSSVCTTDNSCDENARNKVRLTGLVQWHCNSMDLTDEGVGSEHLSADQSSRLHETQPGTDTLARLAKNNYNIRSLRHTLRELSSCYNDMLERNLTLERRLNQALQNSRRSSKEKQLLLELQTSYALLKAVVESCLSSPSAPLQLLASTTKPQKVTDTRLKLRDVTTLRRSIEELCQAVFERLVISRYRL